MLWCSYHSIKAAILNYSTRLFVHVVLFLKTFTFYCRLQYQFRIKVQGLKPGRGQRIKGDRNRSMSSYGVKVNPSAQVVRFYGMLKIPSKYEKDTS
jgi:hypothetical protein